MASGPGLGPFLPPVLLPPTVPTKPSPPSCEQANPDIADEGAIRDFRGNDGFSPGLEGQRRAVAQGFDNWKKRGRGVEVGSGFDATAQGGTWKQGF